MPPTHPTRSRASTSAAPRSKARAATAPHSDHVVDRALVVHALLAGGDPPRDVQRRLGKSKGYVSVLGYLGASLAGLEPENFARLRVPALTPRVVWLLVTRARTDEREEIRQTLGAAATEAAREEARRRARGRAIVQLRAALRAWIQAAAAGLTAPPRARGGRRPRATSGVLGAVTLDLTSWAADPVAAAQAYVAKLAAVHGHIAEQAARTVALAGAEHVLAAQVAVAGEGSLKQLGGARWRALAAAARRARTPADDRALAALGVLTRKLREASDEVSRLCVVSPPAIASSSTAPGGVAAAGPPEPLDPVQWEDVEEDLK